ncbi:protein flightless-1 homolog isoform X2 [Oscarella lobularis]|uniref:protein flightless-1 homolog isoform X2 n=1 Tax=Oscarella lobularis TaxID=121494 RepID=UPI0033130BD8
MSQGVLPFIRGINLSENPLENDQQFTEKISSMASLRWLRLNNTKLRTLPDQLSTLKKLEYLAVSRNSLHHLHDGDLQSLSRLRVVNARRNHIKDPGIPPEIFELGELSTIDFSYNQLEKVPEGLEKATGLLVLSLSHNKIEELPKELFVECCDIHHLDLSDNRLTTIPPTLRRCRNMDTLMLANNPMVNSKLRSLQGLVNLRTLNLRNTERNLSNFPEQLDSWLVNLEDLDISRNGLSQIPGCIYRMENLKRLNASHNAISELSGRVENWVMLELLNLSYNKLQELPQNVSKCTRLKRLFLNANELVFEGIPLGISRLTYLEQFQAARNKLQCIPESLCRCFHLRKVSLAGNCLLQLPEGIHYLKNLKELDVRDNPDLVMPAKPPEEQIGGNRLYNIDFDLEKLKQGAVTSEAAGKATSQKRKAQIFDRRHKERQAKEKERLRQADDAQKVLKGLSGIAEEKTRRESVSGGIPEPPPVPEIKRTRKWYESLEKPNLSYDDYFDENTGKELGLLVWQIENFIPVEVEQPLYGQFYSADAFIVLKTFRDEYGALDWNIYFWIGSDATLDKKACSAMHAVNLRNMLGAESRIVREEQNEESDAFLSLFNNEITYVEGGTASGFYTVEETSYPVKLYRVSVHNKIHFELVPVSETSLDPRFVYFLDGGMSFYVWPGPQSSLLLRTKVRLFAEKMNKNERKNKASVAVLTVGKEPQDFWSYLGGQSNPDEIQPHVESFTPGVPRLYRVHLGHGYLELPQVEIHFAKLTASLLEPKEVYILDCHSDIFVWVGRRSARLVRAAALKLAQELCVMLDRPSYAMVTRTLQGTESQIFKSKFYGWDDVLSVDYSRSAESVLKLKGKKTEGQAETATQAEASKTKVDLSSLFMPRQSPISDEQTEFIDECSQELKEMKCFVLEGKKFVKLPDSEIGNFFSEECYVFVCKYWMPPPEEEEDAEDDEELPQDYTVIYFWEGREANKMGWLTFTFSFQRKMEKMIPDLQVIRTRQQQEPLKLLAHFGSPIVIQRGERRLPIDEDDEDDENDTSGSRRESQLLQVRANGSSLYTRVVEVPTDVQSLNSEFCYILKVPFNKGSVGNGVVYVWIGSKSSKAHSIVAEETAKHLFEEWFSIQTIREGSEPENFFWVGIGGRGVYDQVADYMNFTRLFRCSNEKGFFSVSEKCLDFCQDDLADDDVMILDSGSEVFLWVGPGSSDVERKLAAKSAQVYGKHMKEQQPDRPRVLAVAKKGHEPHAFVRCFHGWGPFVHRRF